MTNWKYDEFAYLRRRTRTVFVGDVAIGSDHPIRVQSMTTPSTQDTRATVDQALRLVEAGCEIVRITVPTTRDAENLPNIRRELARHGVRVPLVADIHFTPAAAMKAVEHVDKIRINPGNYADKKKFKIRDYDDSQYEAELERIEQVFSPLVLRARELGVSMRIGTNHGSLSDRIMNRYGDTPLGMVESALEFVRICESRDYRELILSMKSSNPVVVQQVYRLLAARMADEGMDYPFHLGVTEAGDGEDGRIKSAIGMGSLLDEGLGDTVRVSLTEDPALEIPVALALVDRYNRRDRSFSPAIVNNRGDEARDPFQYSRRISQEIPLGPFTVGGDHPVLVELPLNSPVTDEEAIRRELDAQVGVRVPEETRGEIISLCVENSRDVKSLAILRSSLKVVAPRVALSTKLTAEYLQTATPTSMGQLFESCDRVHLVLDSPVTEAGRSKLTALFQATPLCDSRCVLIEAGSPTGDMETAVDLALEAAGLASGTPASRLMLALTPSPRFSPLHAYRLLVSRLSAADFDLPIVLLDHPEARGVDTLLGAASALGGLLCDGIGDSIQIDGLAATDARRLAFTILQGARVRITKTEFISCPSCGRTLFDLEETTAQIKARTAHLKGLKIAVMGCVVNGPGEMADADFGYVGWGEDKIALFVGKKMVARDIPTSQAVQRLEDLIKEHGRWVEPPVAVVE